jgi:hypothetical protein
MNFQKACLLLGLLGLTVVAFCLRVKNLDGQILGGDELHLLKVITDHSYKEIAGLVTETDFSIPMALFFKFLSQWFPLSEWSLRIIILLVGSLAPALIFLGARRFVPWQTAAILGIVIAVHPFFIFYSRFVRPYGICTVLNILVLILLDQWHGNHRKAWLGGAILIGAASSWLHLVSLTAVACLFGGALVRILCERPETQAAGIETASEGTTPGRWKKFLLCSLAGIACLILTLLLYSPGLSDIGGQIFQGKLGKGLLNDVVFWRNAAVLTGLPGEAPALLFAFLSLAGIIVFLVRKPGTMSFLLMFALLQPILIILIRPHLLEFSFVLARYLFYVLPIWLLFACLGWDFLLRSAGNRIAFMREGNLSLCLAGILGVLWLWSGPYHEVYGGINSYAHHNAYQTFSYRSNAQWKAAGEQHASVRLPSYYSKLGEGGLVLEGPPPENFFDNMVAFYQHFHGRPVKLLTSYDKFWGSSRLNLKNVIVLRGEGKVDFQGAELAIIHKQPMEEIKQFLNRYPSPQAESVYGEKIVSRLSELMEACCEPPVHEDQYLKVFRLPVR